MDTLGFKDCKTDKQAKSPNTIKLSLIKYNNEYFDNSSLLYLTIIDELE